MRSLGSNHLLLVCLLRVIPRAELLFTEGAGGEEGGRLLELLGLLDRREATRVLVVHGLLVDMLQLGRALLLLLFQLVVVDLFEELGEAALVRFVYRRVCRVTRLDLVLLLR